MERLEEPFGLLSLRAHPMAQTFLTAIMLSVSYIVSYISIIIVYTSLKDRFSKAFWNENRAKNTQLYP